MLTKKDLRPYQLHTVDHVLNHEGAGLFLDMGLGKTIATLTAIDQLMYEEKINKTLIVAPKNVALTVWHKEIQNWAHVKHLRYSIVWGTKKQRLKALQKDADVYITNRENLAWLVALYGGRLRPDMDMFVLDELSSYKNSDTQRFKAAKMAREHVKRIVGLTGTPAANSLTDLWAEVYLLDEGERLGKFITHFRNNFFNAGDSEGHVVYNYKIKSKEHKKILFDKIKDICISMKKEDYLTLPKLIEENVEVILPDDKAKLYADFEAEQVLQLFADTPEEKEITAFNAAALYNKLLQFSNGAVYDEDKNVHEMHNAKLDALGELLEAAGGENVIVVYNFRHDLDRMQKRFGGVVYSEKIDKEWNEGKIKLMYIHPASAGHGLNLQFGGHILIWFGQNWSLEFSQQTRDRIYRSGQISKFVRVFRLMCKNTIDEEVLIRLNRKADDQNAVMDAVKAIIKKYQ